jgi:outer membrane murein-binding lipoprotein Lpp
MPQHYISFFEQLPFVALAMGKVERPLYTKLFETAIMSVVAGAVGVYVGVEVIKNDLTYLKAGVTETNHKIEKLEEKVEQIRSDLYVPRGAK